MRIHLKTPQAVWKKVMEGHNHHLVLSSLAIVVLMIVTLKDRLPWSGHSSSSTSRHKYIRDSHQGWKGSKRRIIYVVTPTYPRPNQIPEMTRLAQTLMLVPDVHWVVAEDTPEENARLLDYLISTGLPYTYLKSPMPKQMHRWKIPPVGVSSRRAALAWIRANTRTGVIYFADDDNTYDYRLFEEIRSTKGVSMFPAGFVTRLQLSTPVVKNGRFAGWYDGWIADRKYPVDMATFAFSVELLHKRPRANMAWTYSYQEESILASLGVKPEDIELKADGCTKIWVWHTKSVQPAPAARDILLPQYDGTNLRILQEQLYIKPLLNVQEHINIQPETSSKNNMLSNSSYEEYDYLDSSDNFTAEYVN